MLKLCSHSVQTIIIHYQKTVNKDKIMMMIPCSLPCPRPLFHTKGWTHKSLLVSVKRLLGSSVETLHMQNKITCIHISDGGESI